MALPIKQVAELLNNAAKEITGVTTVVKEDLSNVVDFGKDVFDNTDVEGYVKAIGVTLAKTVFYNRTYSGFAPSLMRDSFEFGWVTRKMTVDELPDAVNNEAWNLTNGGSIDPYVITLPKLSVKYFREGITLEVDITIAPKQAKMSLNSAVEASNFIAMIMSAVENKMTIDNDILTSFVVKSAIADVMTHGKAAQKVDLRPLYEALYPGQNIDINNAVYNEEFLRLLTHKLKTYSDKLERMTKLYNVGGKPRFTPKDKQRCLVLSDIKRGMETYLYNAQGQFKDENLQLIPCDTVACWQAIADAQLKTDDMKTLSNINVRLTDGTEFNQDGILAILYDYDAMGVNNYDESSDTIYNPKGQYTNYFFRKTARYFVDNNENMIVFYLSPKAA